MGVGKKSKMVVIKKVISLLPSRYKNEGWSLQNECGLGVELEEIWKEGGEQTNVSRVIVRLVKKSESEVTWAAWGEEWEEEKSMYKGVARIMLASAQRSGPNRA